MVLGVEDFLCSLIIFQKFWAGKFFIDFLNRPNRSPAVKDFFKYYFGPYNFHPTYRNKDGTIVGKPSTKVSGVVIFMRYVATSFLFTCTAAAIVGASLLKAGALTWAFGLCLLATAGSACGMASLAVLVTAAVVLGILTLATATFSMLYFAPRNVPVAG